ncbi:MAG: hypothetical protein LBF56_00480 [Holosporales bacterium]|nr:hypothetical protein [Holosporales bacterium]
MIGALCPISAAMLLISGLAGCLFRLFRVARFGAIVSCIAFVICPVSPKPLKFSWFSVDGIDFVVSFRFTIVEKLICTTVLLILTCMYFARKVELISGTVNRIFGVLSVFSFFMCVTVISQNLFQLYVAVEAMGLISVILVGMEKESLRQSSKVYIFNGFAGLLLLIAVISIGLQAKSFDLSEIAAFAAQHPATLYPSVILLTISSMCKGAIMPFSYWLIDAVKAHIFASILIHAGTIVGASIVLMAKCHFLFMHFPGLLDVTLVFGITTALWMACCALSQDNIKRAMACLTSSSAGLMFVACGLQRYQLAILYFICHAFFKALIFLSFAYLVSATSGEQNILKMGGLSKFAPKVNHLIWITFAAAVGIPFLPGFFAKITLMETIQLANLPVLEFMIVTVNVITITAMFRIIFVSMYGTSRMDDITLARVINSSTYDTRPVWSLWLVSAFCAYCAWDIFGYGELSFSSVSGTVFSRNIFDYFLEELAEVLQVGIALLLGLIFARYSRTKISSKNAGPCISAIMENWKYERVCDSIQAMVTKSAGWLDIANARMASTISRQFLRMLYMAAFSLSSKHKKLFCSYVTWSFCGITAILLVLLFG